MDDWERYEVFWVLQMHWHFGNGSASDIVLIRQTSLGSVGDGVLEGRIWQDGNGCLVPCFLWEFVTATRLGSTNQQKQKQPTSNPTATMSQSFRLR
jgi:hypothetical protein